MLLSLPPSSAQVHAAIRKDPTAKLTQKKKPAKPTSWQTKKLTYEQRKANLKAKLAMLKEGGDDE